MPTEAKDVGRLLLNQLMGKGYGEAKDRQRNAFNGVLQDFSEQVRFGRVWARPGIDRQLRSILNIAMLTALNRPGQLRSHVTGALRNGLGVQELREILLHTAVYCGLPAASDAFRIAEEVLQERDLLR